MSPRLRGEAVIPRSPFDLNNALRLLEKHFGNEKAQQASESDESHYSGNFEGEFIKSS